MTMPADGPVSTAMAVEVGDVDPRLVRLLRSGWRTLRLVGLVAAVVVTCWALGTLAGLVSYVVADSPAQSLGTLSRYARGGGRAGAVAGLVAAAAAALLWRASWVRDQARHLLRAIRVVSQDGR